MRPDALALPLATRRVREHAAHDVEHVRVQFYRVDRAGTVAQRPQHLGPTAGAQHQRARAVDQMVGKRRGFSLEIAQVIVGAGDRAGSAPSVKRPTCSGGAGRAPSG